jgi:thiol:disulfide interchange protein
VPIDTSLTITPAASSASATSNTAAAPAGSAPAAPAAPAAKTVDTAASAHLPWQPFTAQRLADLTAAGKTVLIDFTADWCPNCKLNELIALNTRQTADFVQRNGVVPLLADFTREDPQIRDWLTKFRSVSVPLTVIIPGSRPTEPILLRDTYRQATLLDALRKAGPSMAPADLRTPLTLATSLVISETDGSTWWYLLAGFVGGFILNFMPCVLPVISIKVLSLLGQAGESRRRVLGLGLSFSGGMVALFLALGLLVTVAGQTWGALFQSAAFLVVMLGVIVAMSCSLFGAFTLSVPAAVGEADAAIEGEGYVGSFGKGVLAVLLGTPCSGPFLGSALAWAVARSAAGQPAVGMLVFVAMGVGMAFPFVLLAAQPGWMRYLPRPGAWMETFKQAMGFLLLLTAVYIIYLLQDRVLLAILFSLGIAFAAWLYGKLVRPGRSVGANWLGRGIVAGLVAVLLWIGLAPHAGRASPAATGETQLVSDLRPE